MLDENNTNSNIISHDFGSDIASDIVDNEDVLQKEIEQVQEELGQIEFEESIEKNATWFQLQINNIARGLSESAGTQLSIKIPTINYQLIQYFKQERGIQIAASLLTNRLLQYVLESLHFLSFDFYIATKNGFKVSSNTPNTFHSLMDETGKINLSNMLSESDHDIIVGEIVMILQMEYSQIVEQARIQQQQQQQQSSVIQPNSNGFIR